MNTNNILLRIVGQALVLLVCTELLGADDESSPAQKASLEVVPVPNSLKTILFVGPRKSLRTYLPSPGGDYQFSGPNRAKGQDYARLRLGEGRQIIRSTGPGQVERTGRTWRLTYSKLYRNDIVPMLSRLYRISSITEGERRKMKAVQLEGEMVPPGIEPEPRFCAVPLDGILSMNGRVFNQQYLKVTKITPASDDSKAVATVEISNETVTPDTHEVRVGDTVRLAEHNYRIIAIVPPDTKPRRIGNPPIFPARIIGWVELTPVEE